MSNRFFGEKLLEIIGLLTGLYIFNALMSLVAPWVAYSMGFENSIIYFAQNSSLVGNIIFGIIIYRLTKENNSVAAPVGALSATVPIFGGLFFLLMLANKAKA